MLAVFISIKNYFVADWEKKEGPYVFPSVSAMVVSTMVLFIFLVIYNSFYAIYFSKGGFDIYYFGECGLLVLGLFFIKYTGKKKTASFILILSGYTTNLLGILSHGGLFSIDLFWLVFTSTVSFLFNGVAAGMVISFANIAAVIFIYYNNHGSPENGLYEMNTFISLQLLYIALLTFFVKHLIQSNKEIKKMNEERLEELTTLVDEKTRENMGIRSQVVRDFHDLMGNKLATISSLSQMLYVRDDYSEEEFEKQLKHINKISKEIYDSTKDFIWSLQLDQNNLMYLYSYIKEFAEKLFQFSAIEFISEPIDEASEKITLSQYQCSQLMLILKEAFTNVLVHSEASSVALSLQRKQSEYLICIEDNGKGFEETSLSRINGIKNMKARAEALSVKLQISSKSHQGTSIVLYIPSHHH
ncbi:MAG: hypothetical protein MUF42_06770 [Cytophagaceae bacterium]|jgi:signal transduction histidine kinase|nr:hypothetical protein [Cytophagaceae bacterium]